MSGRENIWIVLIESWAARRGLTGDVSDGGRQQEYSFGPFATVFYLIQSGIRHHPCVLDAQSEYSSLAVFRFWALLSITWAVSIVT